tara:strand:- start:527 stop:961 length:435 start_codon:yes stop_codon:yes gene_type:complete
MRKIKYIVVHHTASGEETTLEDVSLWHKARGFSRVSGTNAGYHYLIEASPKPTIRLGRSPDRTGAHARGYNSGSIGCAIVGSFEDGSVPSPEQYRLAVQLVADLSRQHPEAAIKGHSELGSTQCPGIDMVAFRQAVQECLQCHR